MHHRHKVDAPSGTALLLGQAAAEGGAWRSPSARSRCATAIPAPASPARSASRRSARGSVVGEHSVIFAGAGERIELSHLASDRGLFAAGAVKAALWAQSREPGFYGMDDVLGL